MHDLHSDTNLCFCWKQEYGLLLHLELQIQIYGVFLQDFAWNRYVNVYLHACV